MSYYPQFADLLNQALARLDRPPAWLAQRLDGYGQDRDSVRAFGIEVVSRLCEKLLAGGAPGFHFYTMNQAGPTLSILANLGIRS